MKQISQLQVIYLHLHRKKIPPNVKNHAKLGVLINFDRNRK